MEVQRTRLVRVALPAAALVLAAHGLIHLMGVALLWRIGEPGELRYTDVWPAAGSTPGFVVGALWLAAAALFVVAAVLVVQRRSWVLVGAVAAALSLVVLLPSASMAAFGIAVDVAVLAAAFRMRSS